MFLRDNTKMTLSLVDFQSVFHHVINNDTLKLDGKEN